MRLLNCAVIGIAMSLPVEGADRPTTEMIAAAVEASRIAYAKTHPVPTKTERLRELNTELKRLQTLQSRVSGKDAKAKIQENIRDIQQQIRETKKNYKPEIFTRLAALNIHEMKIGDVGRLGPETRGRLTSGTVRCIQILEADRILAEYSYSEITVNIRGNTVTSGPSREINSKPFLLIGIDASNLAEGRDFDGPIDVVVVGQYTYIDTLGAMRTVFAVEVFNPEQPFK